MEISLDLICRKQGEILVRMDGLERKAPFQIKGKDLQVRYRGEEFFTLDLEKGWEFQVNDLEPHKRILALLLARVAVLAAGDSGWPDTPFSSLTRSLSPAMETRLRISLSDREHGEKIIRRLCAFIALG